MKINEKLIFYMFFSTIINTKLPYNLNHNNNKQNVQNERKIADHLAYNHHINSDNSINLVRLKRDISNLYDDDDNDLINDGLFVSLLL